MASLGFHPPFEDSHIHIKILNTCVCFSPVKLSYVGPATKPKTLEGRFSSQAPLSLQVQGREMVSSSEDTSKVLFEAEKTKTSADF